MSYRRWTNSSLTLPFEVSQNRHDAIPTSGTRTPHMFSLGVPNLLKGRILRLQSVEGTTYASVIDTIMTKRRPTLKNIVLIPLFLFSFSLLCSAQDAATGRWEGAVKIPERELKVIVDLAQQGGAGWIGSIIIPGLDIQGAALTEIAVDGAEVSFAIKSALATEGAGQAKFKAHFTAKDTLTGDFLQAGNTARFTLTRTGAPQVESAPRSTIVSNELEGEWKGEYDLFGYPRHVTIKLVNHGSEGAAAEFVVVGKRTNNLPVDLVTQEGDLLTITSQESGINYEGRFDRKTGEIKGTFTQGAIELPLVLRRGS
jgi:hypothetical protein